MAAAPSTQPGDTEPKCEWVQKEGFQTLLVHLPGYKRENLKVQVTTSRNLRVLGELKINERKWRRFQKEFSLPDECDINGITAKFEGEVLQVRLPKVSLPAADPVMPKDEAKLETALKPATAAAAAAAKTEDGKKAGTEADGRRKKRNEKMERVAEDAAKGGLKFGREGKYRKKTALLAVIVLAVAVAVAFGGRMLLKMRKEE